MLEAEIRSLQRRLVRRDNEILKQERELHKLRVGALEENIYTFIQKIFKCYLKIFKDFLLRLHFHSITNKSCHKPLEGLAVSSSQGTENI